MSNTIDILGDELVQKTLIEKTISEFEDQNIKVIGIYAFANCKNLETAILPSVTTVSSNAFEWCNNMRYISIPMVKTIWGNAFSQCSSIRSISLPNVSYMSTFIFNGCISLESVYLLGQSVPYVSSYTFYGTPIGDSFYLSRFGSIFVRASMLESFQSATNMAYFSSRLVGLTDEQIAALDNE